MFRSLSIPLPSRHDFDDFDMYLTAPLPEDLDSAEDFVSYEQALAELTYDLIAMDEETKEEEEEVCMCGQCPGCGKPIADCVLSDVWCTNDNSVMGTCMKCSVRFDYGSEHIMSDTSNAYMAMVIPPPQIISPQVMLPWAPLCIPSATGGRSTFIPNSQPQPLQYYTPVLPVYAPVIEAAPEWFTPIPLPQYMRCQPRVNVKIAPHPDSKALTPCIPLEARTRLYEGCLDTPSTFNSDLLGCIDTLASVLVAKLNLE
jgi:hypothetical protein